MTSDRNILGVAEPFDPPALAGGRRRFRRPCLDEPVAIVVYNIGFATGLFEEAIGKFREQFEIGIDHGIRAFR